MNWLTIRTIRLADLYGLDKTIDTTDEYVMNKFIEYEVERRQKQKILEYKKSLWL